MRLYLDRIFVPEPQSTWQKMSDIKQVPDLVCPSCGARIGSPMIYQRENRLAIRLNRGSFYKIRSNGTYPSQDSD